MEQNSIFRQTSLDKLSSPERLEDYIRVSSPSVWLVLAAFFILTISIIVWSTVGNLPKMMTISGVIDTDGNVVCYVNADHMAGSLEGHKAQITLPDNTVISGTVDYVSINPYSTREIVGLLNSDWLAEKLLSDNYSYAVKVHVADAGKASPGTIVSVALITAEVKPIRFLLD